MTQEVRVMLQLTLDGNFIKEWDSLKEAAIHLGFHYSNISKVIKGKQNSVKGYKWKYKEK